jgi:hypothetical protein
MHKDEMGDETRVGDPDSMTWVYSGPYSEYRCRIRNQGQCNEEKQTFYYFFSFL